MERRGANTWLIAVLAIAVGFLAALLILGNDDNNNSSATVSQTTSTTTQTGATDTTSTNGTSTPSSTTATQQGTTPQAPEATTQNCINLWNQQNNRANQTFLVNVMSNQAVRIHVGVTSDVPPKCLVTIVANDGKAYVFPEGGGTTFPYAVGPGSTDSSSLPAAQKISNALEEPDGTVKAR